MQKRQLAAAHPSCDLPAPGIPPAHVHGPVPFLVVLLWRAILSLEVLRCVVLSRCCGVLLSLPREVLRCVVL